VTAKDVKKQPGITIRPAPTGQETKASYKAPQTSSSGGKSNAPTLVFWSSQSEKGQTKKPNDKNDAAMAQQVKKSQALLV